MNVLVTFLVFAAFAAGIYILIKKDDDTPTGTGTGGGGRGEPTRTQEK